MLRTQVIKTYPERLSYSPWHQVYLLSTSQCVSPHNVAETHLAPASFIALTTESGLCGLLLVPPSFRQPHRCSLFSRFTSSCTSLHLGLYLHSHHPSWPVFHCRQCISR